MNSDRQLARRRKQVTDSESVVIIFLCCSLVRQLNVLVERMARVVLHKDSTGVILVGDGHANIKVAFTLLGSEVDLQLVDVRFDVEIKPVNLSLIVRLVTDLLAFNSAEPLCCLGFVWKLFHVHGREEVFAFLESSLA